jgi:hypothetical protein
VAERLAACANILPGMTSLYWWEGDIQEASEAVLVAKTRQGLAGALAARVGSALHDVTARWFWPSWRQHPCLSLDEDQTETIRDRSEKEEPYRILVSGSLATTDHDLSRQVFRSHPARQDPHPERLIPGQRPDREVRGPAGNIAYSLKLLARTRSPWPRGGLRR